MENTRRAARGRDRSEIPPLPVVRVVPFNEYQRNRYYR